MAWSDDPTDAQLNAIFMMIRWYVPTTTAQKSIRHKARCECRTR